MDWSKITLEDLNKIDISKPDAKGCTPMHYLAAENYDTDVIRTAYSKVKHNLVDNQGYTPFDHAISSRNIDAIDVFEGYHAKSTLKPREYCRVDINKINKHYKPEVSKYLAFDNKEIKLETFTEKFDSYSKADDFMRKQKLNNPKLSEMTLTELDTHLKNAKTKFISDSELKNIGLVKKPNKPISASQQLQARRTKAKVQGLGR